MDSLYMILSSCFDLITCWTSSFHVLIILYFNSWATKDIVITWGWRPWCAYTCCKSCRQSCSWRCISDLLTCELFLFFNFNLCDYASSWNRWSFIWKICSTLHPIKKYSARILFHNRWLSPSNFGEELGHDLIFDGETQFIWFMYIDQVYILTVKRFTRYSELTKKYIF